MIFGGACMQVLSQAASMQPGIPPRAEGLLFDPAMWHELLKA